jgi:hypothetical protein
MGMTPSNTPLEQWLTVWIFHEVESIVDRKFPKMRFQYTGMSPEQRRHHNLPTNRESAIAFIKEHRNG